MTAFPVPGPVPTVPQGWTTRVPTEADTRALTALMARHQRSVRGRSGVDPEMVLSEVVGTGSWTRRQVLLLDEHDEVRAWAAVHDRAAGRTNIALTIDPDCSEETADALAQELLDWIVEVARAVASERALESTQLDASLIDGDERTTRWFTRAGLRPARTWLQMTRPVEPDEQVPPPREGVHVQRVATHETGLPIAEHVRAVHHVLEESFADHWGSYRESFPEFMQRLREDPGHRWDHWWLATVDTDEGPQLGGAVVSTVLHEDADGIEGSYIDYIGVHRRARGRGVAKALLNTVIADARDRGRNRVGLEVDDESPTGADGLYTSMGWVTQYRTQTWQLEVDVPPPSKPAMPH